VGGVHFRIGQIPDNPDFAPGRDGWRRLREPRVWVFQVCGILAGLAAAAGLAWLWAALTPAFTNPRWSGTVAEGLMYAAAIPVAFIGLVAGHELLHAAVHPGCGLRPATVLGVWPAGQVVYAHYDGPMPRNRFVAMILLPFVALSLVPPAVCAAAGLGPPVVAGCSVLNALFGGGDLVAAGLVLAQVPARAEVRNQGWWTWWRATAAEPGAAADPRRQNDSEG
jgi:hypothetical protein